MRGHKAYVLALGAVGLASALTIAALVAPNRAGAAVPTYVPMPDEVVARVPRRDAREVAERQALLASPERVELAVELARADIERSRKLSDPRYLGHAQATLSRWWHEAQPPADVLLLRATIEQSLHDFTAARRDLDLLVTLTDDPQAHLTRAVVASVTGDYATARESCAHLTGFVQLACVAPIDALAEPGDAYAKLATTLEHARLAPALHAWARTLLGEIAIQRGDEPLGAAHLRAVLATDPNDAYARAALADSLLAEHDPAAASALLAGYEQIDNLLVRRAIAEHRANGPEAARLAKLMRDRIAAAAERGDRIHVREEAMFVLAVEGDAPRALRLARENWSVQKELADARLLAEAAAANHTHDDSLTAWLDANHVRDARLARWSVR